MCIPTSKYRQINNGYLTVTLMCTQENNSVFSNWNHKGTLKTHRRLTSSTCPWTDIIAHKIEPAEIEIFWLVNINIIGIVPAQF